MSQGTLSSLPVQDDLALLLHPTRPRECRLLNISWQREQDGQFVFLHTLKKALSSTSECHFHAKREELAFAEAQLLEIG